MMMSKWRRWQNSSVTYPAACAMTNAELLYHLVNGQQIANLQRVAKERVANSGLANFYELLQKEMLSSSLLAMPRPAPAAPKPAEMDLNDPRNYLAFYQMAMDEGYHCEGMRDPESAWQDVKSNLLMRDPWDELFEGGQKFYLSFRRHYYRWKVTQMDNSK